MLNVNVLAHNMRVQNSRGFLFPLLVNRGLLGDTGVRVQVHRTLTSGLTDCDALFVDGKVLDALTGPDGAAAQLAAWRAAVPVGYFDVTDSATTIRSELLSHTTLYFKNQLARDRTVLSSPLYGHRLYADYYHRTAGVSDDSPASSTPITDPSLIERLRVGWNASLANYAIYGPRLATLYDRLPFPLMLFYPRRFRSPAAYRDVPVNCRMNVRYARNTVAYQRRRTMELLANHARADRISKSRYFRELARSRIAVSPFGWGEINQKDYECFIAGVCVVKPAMEHLETWPNLFEREVTYRAHDWNMSDLVNVVTELLAHDRRRREIAQGGQDRYRFHIASRAGREAFCARIGAIVRDLTGAAERRAAR